MGSSETSLIMKSPIEGKNFYANALPTNFLPLENNIQGGGCRISYNNYREISCGGYPLCPHKRFFNQGQKHYISNFFKFREGICHLWFDLSGAYARYTSRLDAPLVLMYLQYIMNTYILRKLGYGKKCEWWISN